MKKQLLVAGVAGALAVAAVPAVAATKSIKVADNVFRPSSVSLKKGDTARFRWVGDAPHNVTVTKGPVRFHSRTQRKGSFSKRLTRRGTYRIVCTIHPGMNLTLRVR